jgi:nucleoside-diphosphate-sugar epimerase
MDLNGKRFLLVDGAELSIHFSRGSHENLAPALRDPRGIGCPRKAREELGFEAVNGLREGLAHLIPWRAEHREELRRRRRAAGLDP